MHSMNNLPGTKGLPLLIRPGFLDPHTCSRIRRGMDSGFSEAAEIVGGGITRRETVRRAQSIEIDPPILAVVERRLEAVRPTLERTMNQPLGEREGTGFLRYPPGGLYRTHRDRGAVAGWPAAARRLVTVVIFLNGGTDNSGPRDFEGGELCLYPNARPVLISPVTGLLVAFPADFLHEVRPVVSGWRDSAIDWFYESTDD
jgi:predicted 2-oxoglutarate/Fe(II)-dependent dioxygenase YbiX